MPLAASHRVDVRNKPAFLRRTMSELSGDARLSLEGDLSRCRFSSEVLIGQDETPVLTRGTIWPRQDFVVLRLRAETVEPIFMQVMAA